jgi:hypothetical protein
MTSLGEDGSPAARDGLGLPFAVQVVRWRLCVCHDLFA